MTHGLNNMDKSEHAFYANELFEAERNRAPIPPITERASSFGVKDAYAVQIMNIAKAFSIGYTASGKKIGLTSAAIQRQFGVNEPDYGHLFAAMECIDGVVYMDGLIQPKIEAELAFILKKDLYGGRVTAEEAEDATEYITAAFEIVDSRIEGWRIKLADTIADNASSGRYILGGDMAAPKNIDFRSVSMKLYKVEEDRSLFICDGTGAAVMGDPRLSVAWLANKLHEYGGGLRAGEVVLSGAFSAAPAVRAGDTFMAYFSDIGKVEASFV